MSKATKRIIGLSKFRPVVVINATSSLMGNSPQVANTAAH